jgi:hypothetical protein
MDDSLSSDFWESMAANESATRPDAILREEVRENLKAGCGVSIHGSEPSNVDRSPSNEIFHTRYEEPLVPRSIRSKCSSPSDCDRLRFLSLLAVVACQRERKERVGKWPLA